MKTLGAPNISALIFIKILRKKTFNNNFDKLFLKNGFFRILIAV